MGIKFELAKAVVGSPKTNLVPAKLRLHEMAYPLPDLTADLSFHNASGLHPTVMEFGLRRHMLDFYWPYNAFSATFANAQPSEAQLDAFLSAQKNELLTNSVMTNLMQTALRPMVWKWILAHWPRDRILPLYADVLTDPIWDDIDFLIMSSAEAENEHMKAVTMRTVTSFPITIQFAIYDAQPGIMAVAQERRRGKPSEVWTRAIGEAHKQWAQQGRSRYNYLLNLTEDEVRLSLADMTEIMPVEGHFIMSNVKYLPLFDPKYFIEICPLDCATVEIAMVMMKARPNVKPTLSCCEAATADQLWQANFYCKYISRRMDPSMAFCLLTMWPSSRRDLLATLSSLVYRGLWSSRGPLTAFFDLDVELQSCLTKRCFA